MFPHWPAAWERFLQDILDAETLNDLAEKVLHSLSGYFGITDAAFWVAGQDDGLVFCRAATGWLADQNCAYVEIADLQPWWDKVTALQRLPAGDYPFSGKHASGDALTVLPFRRGETSIAWLVFAGAPPDLEAWGQRLTAYLTPLICNLRRLEAAIQGGQRQEAVLSVLQDMTTLLDREMLLCRLLDAATAVLDVEVCSLFLLSPEKDALILHLASNQTDTLNRIRIPTGVGIIGETVRSGKTFVLNDVKRDPRHFSGVDETTGFVTRSLISVPLFSSEVTIGSGQKRFTDGQIIGGMQAVNKRIGRFTSADVLLLEHLARQAAIIMNVASLYEEAQQLFLDMLQALAAFVDSKDPYTTEHALRVSEFSEQIAREMGFSPEECERARLGGLLHDIGKITIPDEILKKKDFLTADEYAVMRSHPLVGEQVIGRVHLLHDILPAIGQHHEKMDGSGYPRGLKGEEIHWLGRIVSVADAFDALTSDRPYRKAASAEEALDVLHREAGRSFDPRCVQAITSLYLRGEIRTAHERDLLARAREKPTADEQDFSTQGKNT